MSDTNCWDAWFEGLGLALRGGGCANGQHPPLFGVSIGPDPTELHEPVTHYELANPTAWWDDDE